MNSAHAGVLISKIYGLLFIIMKRKGCRNSKIVIHSSVEIRGRGALGIVLFCNAISNDKNLIRNYERVL